MPAHRYHDRYEFLPKSAILGFEDIARVAGAVAELGAVKLRVTGGEPLLRRDLPRLVEKLAAIPNIEDIALTTNGVLLPRFARDLKDAGLGRVTVSLDSLDPEVFRRMSGGFGSVDEVLAGIAAAQAAGLGPVKVNTVVVRGWNDGGLVDMARHFRHTGVTVRFIEYMDVGTINQWQRDAVVPAREIVAAIAGHFPLHPVDPNYPGEVAARYAYDDGAGEIGVIASVSQPFCGDCSRLRMSVDGMLYTCLFGNHGHDLRPVLAATESTEALAAAVAELWRGRDDRYSELRAAGRVTDDKVEMYHIGG